MYYSSHYSKAYKNDHQHYETFHIRKVINLIISSENVTKKQLSESCEENAFVILFVDTTLYIICCRLKAIKQICEILVMFCVLIISIMMYN